MKKMQDVEKVEDRKQKLERTILKYAKRPGFMSILMSEHWPSQAEIDECRQRQADARRFCRLSGLDPNEPVDAPYGKPDKFGQTRKSRRVFKVEMELRDSPHN